MIGQELSDGVDSRLTSLVVIEQFLFGELRQIPGGTATVR